MDETSPSGGLPRADSSAGANNVVFGGAAHTIIQAGVVNGGIAAGVGGGEVNDVLAVYRAAAESGRRDEVSRLVEKLRAYGRDGEADAWLVRFPVEVPRRAEVVRVGLIDNDPLILRGTGPWLASGAPDLEIATVASSVDEYLLLKTLDQVVLLDLELKDGSHFVENVSRLTRRGYRVVLVSVHADLRFKIDAVRAGAVTYLTKDSDRDVLAAAIRGAADGTLVLDQELAFAISRDRSPNRPVLSTQEAEVMRLRGRAVPMKAIAERLGVKERTAYSYLERVKDKYRTAGRPFSTVADLQERLREDEAGS